MKTYTLKLSHDELETVVRELKKDLRQLTRRHEISTNKQGFGANKRVKRIQAINLVLNEIISQTS